MTFEMSFIISITYTQQLIVSCQICSLFPLSKFVYAMLNSKINKNNKNNNQCLLCSDSWNETMRQNPFTAQNVQPSIAQLEDKYCCLSSEYQKQLMSKLTSLSSLKQALNSNILTKNCSSYYNLFISQIQQQDLFKLKTFLLDNIFKIYQVFSISFYFINH